MSQSLKQRTLFALEPWKYAWTVWKFCKTQNPKCPPAGFMAGRHVYSLFVSSRGIQCFDTSSSCINKTSCFVLVGRGAGLLVDISIARSPVRFVWLSSLCLHYMAHQVDVQYFPKLLTCFQLTNELTNLVTLKHDQLSGHHTPFSSVFADLSHPQICHRIYNVLSLIVVSSPVFMSIIPAARFDCLRGHNQSIQQQKSHI